MDLFFDFDSSVAKNSTEPRRKLADRYELRERLGEGATGVVYRGVDLHLAERECAIKILFPHLVLSEEALLQFKREVLVTRRLSHPAIIQTYSFVETELGEAVLVMEYIRGQTLRSALAENSDSLDLQRTVSILYSLLCGLDYAHGIGIVHRDIKPDNVMLDSDLTPKIADFGIAQSVAHGNGGVASAAVGTPCYMSPEAFAGEHSQATTDIYSFGVLAFELLTGRLPFPQQNLFELALAHTDHPPPPLTEGRFDIPAWLQELVGSCLNKSPLDRPDAKICVNAFQDHADRGEPRLLLPAAMQVEMNFANLDNEHADEDTYEPPRSHPFRWLIGSLLALLCVFLIIARAFSGVSWVVLAGIAQVENSTGLHLPLLYRLAGHNKDVRDPSNLTGVLNRNTLWVSLIAGVGPNVRDDQGRTPLLRLTRDRGVSNFRKRSLAMLIEHGADVNLPDDLGRTPVWHSVDVAEGFSTELFLSAGADPHRGDVDGRTPLHLAAANGYHGGLHMLLRRGASPLFEDIEGRTPLHEAALRCDAKALKAMLQKRLKGTLEPDRELGVELLQETEFCKGESSEANIARQLIRSRFVARQGVDSP